MRADHRTRTVALAGALLVLLSGCSTGASTRTSVSATAATSGAGTADTPSSGSTGSAAGAGTTDSTSSNASTSPSSSTPSTATSSPTVNAAQGGVTVAGTLAPGSLRGNVFAIDPGHNGGNGSHPSQINRKVNIGNGSKACDTTGTQTNAGYTEAAFTWDVSQRLAAILRAAGATVVLSRSSNTGVGPCITERAGFGNRAHATAALSIHGDGAPASGYGFHIIEPASIGSNKAIVVPSAALGAAVRTAFAAGTGEHYSTYTGGGKAITVRSDLGGLNLSAVPKVFIECGNMRNAADARRMSSPAWRQQAAQALATGLAQFAAAR